MKNKLLFFAILNQFCSNIYCQTSCPKKFIESKYKIENSFKMDFNLSQEFTLIGMNKEALIEEDKFLEKGGLDFANPKSIISKDTNLRIISALTYIYDILKRKNIVLLNECHNLPQHRVFFYKILDSLQYYGFNSIFIETLSYAPNDSVYAQNISIEDWGYYTAENVFHQVSHKLKNMNYKLYSYEVDYPRKIDTTRKNSKLYFINKADINWVPIEADSLVLKNFFSSNENTQREAEQALNIYQKITRNKIKKVFIYCGYTHNFKSSFFMGGILQHLLGEKVYSIDQMYLHEHSDIKYENSLYRKYATVSYPFVIIDKQNNPIHTIRHYKKNYITDTLFDVSIASPRSIYINNRPTWLELYGDRKRYKLSALMDIIGITDYLITIYDIEHDLNKSKYPSPHAIPVDVFQVIGSGENYDAILIPNKKYKLVAVKNGEIITDKIINTNE